MTTALRRIHAEAVAHPDNGEHYRAMMAIFEPLAAFIEAHADDPALAASPTFADLKHAVASRDVPVQTLSARPAIAKLSRSAPADVAP